MSLSSGCSQNDAFESLKKDSETEQGNDTGKDSVKGDNGGIDIKYESQGPYPVGNVGLVLVDASRSRSLRVEIWYPASESARGDAEEGRPVENFVPSGGPEREIYVQLLADAPQPGPTLRTHSALEAEPAEGGDLWPLAVFSHCMNCVRFSSFSIAERLASHGIAVAAPDHTGGTLFDSIEGDAAFMTADFLNIRAGDVMFVLDSLLDSNTAEVPEYLRGRFDSERVGLYGHSFGGVTTGLVLTLDDRPLAGLALAVPMENPLLPGGTMADIKVPVFFLLAREDNMIYEIGNDYIRDNFEKANPPAWKAEVRDAGHMSFSDICRITESYHAGCGEGKRHKSPHETFTYLDINTGIAIAQAYTTAFFSAFLLDDKKALSYLNSAQLPDVVEISRK